MDQTDKSSKEVEKETDRHSSCSWMAHSFAINVRARTVHEHLPAFLRWSSIITDDIMNTFPMLPMTDRHASTNNLAMLGHSVDNVTGEKSFMCGLLLLPKPWWKFRCENSGVANVVVAVAETTAGAIADNVLAVTLLFKSIVATVVVAFILDGMLCVCVCVLLRVLCLCSFVCLLCVVPCAKPVSNKWCAI